jgi:hypothetical protein
MTKAEEAKLKKIKETLEKEGFKPVEITGEIEKWDEVGQMVQGVFVAKRPGQVGKLLDIKDGILVRTFSCPTLLDRLTGGFSEGDGIVIIYMGEVQGKGPKPYKTFQVLRKDEDIPF